MLVTGAEPSLDTAVQAQPERCPALAFLLWHPRPAFRRFAGGCRRISPVLQGLCLLLASFGTGCSGPTPSAPEQDRLVLVESKSADAYTLSGMITFSSTLPARTLVVLELSDASQGTANLTLESVQSFREHALARPSASIPYEMRVLPGAYLISAYVDQDHDAALGERDMGGYYASDATTPVSHGSAATVVEVTTQSVASLDFMVGPLQCLAKVGEACAADEDCRRTRCSSSLALPGQCDDSARVCVLTECAAGSPEEASCLGN